MYEKSLYPNKFQYLDGIARIVLDTAYALNHNKRIYTTGRIQSEYDLTLEFEKDGKALFKRAYRKIKAAFG